MYKISIIILSVFLVSCTISRPDGSATKKTEHTYTAIDTPADLGETAAPHAPHLYDLTGSTDMFDPEDLAGYQKKLKELQEKTKSEGFSDVSELMLQARYFEYTGFVGQAIELLESQYETHAAYGALVYHHNLAELYRSVGHDDGALERYEVLVRVFDRPEYLRKVADIWEGRGDMMKAKNALRAQEKLISESSIDIK